MWYGINAHTSIIIPLSFVSRIVDTWVGEVIRASCRVYSDQINTSNHRQPNRSARLFTDLIFTYFFLSWPAHLRVKFSWHLNVKFVDD